MCDVAGLCACRFHASVSMTEWSELRRLGARLPGEPSFAEL
jgi:hypothetical protein